MLFAQCNIALSRRFAVEIQNPHIKHFEQRFVFVAQRWREEILKGIQRYAQNLAVGSGNVSQMYEMVRHVVMNGNR